MFATPGLLALVFLEYLRPQEHFPFLVGVPVLHIAAGFALFGFVLDLRLGISRRDVAPHLLLALAFFGWALATVAVRAPEQLGLRAQALAIPFAFYAVVAHGVQGFRGLQAICAVLLAIVLGLSGVGVHQGVAPYGCHRIEPRRDGPAYVFDGRPCEEGLRRTCEGEDAEPGADYVCEKVGLLGTQSVGGRVRYRGTLQDPNELALVLGIALPFAFAFLDRHRSAVRLLLVALTIGAAGLCVLFTQSRGGQLVFLTVLGVYFIRRVGVRGGLVVGTLLALPVLLFGGRTGAESSTLERTECWWVGLHLLMERPALGVGFAQFTEHHVLTAHNSLILVAAELGVVGTLLWSSIVYLAVKVPVQALRSHLPQVARSWGIALLASIAGLLVGSMFLSYAYKNVFWLFMGLTGVLYQAIRRHDPAFTVKFGLRDLALVAAVDAALLFLLSVYTWRHLGW